MNGSRKAGLAMAKKKSKYTQGVRKTENLVARSFVKGTGKSRKRKRLIGRKGRKFFRLATLSF